MRLAAASTTRTCRSSAALRATWRGWTIGSRQWCWRSSAARRSSPTRKVRRHHGLRDEKADSAAAVPPRRRCDTRAPAARRDDAGAGANGGAAEDAVRRHLLPARDGAGAVGAAGGRKAAGEAAVHSRIARARQEPDDGADRTLVEVGGAA